MVGCTLALALAQHANLNIAILERHQEATQTRKLGAHYHHRVSAIAPSSQRIFQALHIWDALKAKRVSPFLKMEVWDATNGARIAFAANDVNESQLGYIIENDLIHQTLLEHLKKRPTVEIISPIKLKTCRIETNNVFLSTENDDVYSAKLVVGADGANSWMRNAVGIEVNRHDYEQSGLVATVRTTLPHEAHARQVFLKQGPLAFLPLAEPNLCSIVWSLPQEEAEEMCRSPEEEFKNKLALAFSQKLGEIVEVQDRVCFPLQKLVTKQYIKSRVALIGDAAHTIHPLAGQGVNMGLLDAAALYDVITKAYQAQQDFGKERILRQYERWRRADNLPLLIGLDLIKSLFASEGKSVQQLRSFGLKMTNQIDFIKNIFTRHAVGRRNDLPYLANSHARS